MATLTTWVDVSPTVVRLGPDASSPMKLLVLYSHPAFQTWLSWRPRWTSDSPVPRPMPALFRYKRISVSWIWQRGSNRDVHSKTYLEPWLPRSLTHHRFTNICARSCPRDPPSRSHSEVGRQWCPRPLQFSVETQWGRQQWDRGRPLPISGQRAWMSTPVRSAAGPLQPSLDSPGPREAISGSFKDLTKVVPPQYRLGSVQPQDWGPKVLHTIRALQDSLWPLQCSGFGAGEEWEWA